MKATLVLLGILLCSSPAGIANDDLKQRLDDEHGQSMADHWIYNDIPKGRQLAAETGKPLFVTFRCVPCKDCMGFDAVVAAGSKKLADLTRDNFVCVRQVEMKNVDLSIFQFDHDLNWAGFFMNADGTVYARYGTQSEKGADAYNNVKGLANTMNRVLQLHSNYPQNKAMFAGKLPEPKPWKKPRDMKFLQTKLLNEAKTSRKNCIHCHNIHDAEHGQWTADGTFSQDKLWRYPLPENIGLTIDQSDGRTISEVASGSAAATAGLQAGQEINLINGQAISSIADMQWVLHHQPNSDDAAVRITLADGTQSTVALAEGWKVTDISWRGSLYSVSPVIRIWMPPLNSFDKEKRGLSDETNALLVKWINTGSPSGQAAKKAGLKNGDLVMEFDGQPVAGNHARFLTQLKLNYKVGDTVPLTILRGKKRMQIELPLVE